MDKRWVSAYRRVGVSAKLQIRRNADTPARRHGLLPKSGQTTSETLLLLPFYLMLIFGVLQLGQLATALLVANYAASSVARQMVQRGTTNPAEFEPRFHSLLTVGMKRRSAILRSEIVEERGPLKTIKVHACADIAAYPFVGELILRPALGTKYRGAGCGAGSSRSIGPFHFNGTPPYAFTVHGSAVARMNYQP